MPSLLRCKLNAPRKIHRECNAVAQTIPLSCSMSNPLVLKAEILRLTREYSRQVHGAFRPAADLQRKPWQEGQTIPYAGRVFTEDEVEAAVASTLDFWLTLGSEGEAFQIELAAFLGVRHSLLVNSGSSANLIAISSLTSAKSTLMASMPPPTKLRKWLRCSTKEMETYTSKTFICPTAIALTKSAPSARFWCSLVVRLSLL